MGLKDIKQTNQRSALREPTPGSCSAAFGGPIHAKYCQALPPSINLHRGLDPLLTCEILVLLSVLVFPAFMEVSHNPLVIM